MKVSPVFSCWGVRKRKSHETFSPGCRGLGVKDRSQRRRRQRESETRGLAELRRYFEAVPDEPVAAATHCAA